MSQIIQIMPAPEGLVVGIGSVGSVSTEPFRVYALALMSSDDVEDYTYVEPMIIVNGCLQVAEDVGGYAKLIQSGQ